MCDQNCSQMIVKRVVRSTLCKLLNAVRVVGGYFTLRYDSRKVNLMNASKRVSTSDQT